MQFAPVAPIHILEAFETYKQLGDYHLLLAHDVVKHPDEYRKLFGMRTRQMTVILDNSVVELKEAVSLDMVLEAAAICQPTVIVLPDVYEKQQETIEACDEARKTWKYPLDKLLGVGNWTFMYVPQGTNLPNLIYCAQFFSSDETIGWWGVPRNAADNIGSRIQVSQLMHMLNPTRKMHLLGFSNNIMDDMLTASQNLNGMIQGIDSAVPIRIASLGLPVLMVYEQGLPPRGDWWDNPDTKYVALMSENLKRIRTLLNPYVPFSGEYGIAAMSMEKQLETLLPKAARAAR